MAYNKTTWQNGDTITAEKLNNMENGIDSQPFIMLVGRYIDDPDEGTSSCHRLTPFADFEQAIADGKSILLNLVNEDLNNETIRTYTYAGKTNWEGTLYYTFTCSGVSKHGAKTAIDPFIDYMRISMNGGILGPNSVFLTRAY